jgi:Transposase
MKRKRHTEEQIIRILKEHEAGMKTADLCRKHGISEGQKGKSSGDFFLVISHRTGNEPTVSVHEKVVKPEPTAEIVIALNLSRLFSVVRRT